MSKLLTLTETAERLRVSRTTAWRRIKRGDLGAFRDGNVLRIPESEIEAYLAARTTSSRPPQKPARAALSR